jgi:hypothetical protein
VLPAGPMLQQISIACASGATNRLACAQRGDRHSNAPTSQSTATTDRSRYTDGLHMLVRRIADIDGQGAGALQNCSSLSIVDAAAQPAFSDASACPNSSDRTRSAARRCDRSDVAPAGGRVTKTRRRVLLALSAAQCRIGIPARSAGKGASRGRLGIVSEAAQPGCKWRRNAVSQTLRLAAVVALTIIFTGAADPANAQKSGTPTIEVAEVISGEASTQVSFPIRVGPAASIPPNSFVRVRGLPPTVALSDGYSVASGAWAIPLRALPDLKMLLPVGAEERADVLVSLVTADGWVLAEARSSLVVKPPRGGESLPQPETPVSIVPTPPPPVPARRPERGAPPPFPEPTILSETHERAVKLKEKGDEQLAQGLVAPARLLYERATELGIAEAAMALAATYDEAELTSPNLRGVSPDAKEARRWYERARQLGAADADQRLRRLRAIQGN